MTVLLVFGLFIVIATAHNITYLEVPQYGDPRRDARLSCHYVNDAGDPPLHSVKWYRNNEEIFRYTPGQQPPTRTFNTTTFGGVTRESCNKTSCSIDVVLPKSLKDINKRISFTCEVSTERPRFAVVRMTKNLTIAVELKEDPVITGMPSSVQLGEDVYLNCSTAPAMPPANILWYIDGKPETIGNYYGEPWQDSTHHVLASTTGELGLRIGWRPLRLRVTTPRGQVNIRCEALQPIKPPVVRSANASLTVAKSPHLSMFTASGSSQQWLGEVAFVLMCVSVHIFSKYSALSQV